MSVPENIEERLIPFIEGVLNPRETEEVEQAIQADPELRREVEELRQLVGELQEGFASGVKVPQEKLTAEEVAQLSLHQGGVENLPGASELKTRLFLSDDALAEYRMLQSLGKEMASADLNSEEIPPMPESLKAEFRAVAERESKVVPLKPKVGFWGQATGWLDRIDPKPLTAAAAAFAMLSLGVHLYNQPNEQTMAGAEQPTVAFGDKASETPPPMPEALGDGEASMEQGSGSSAPDGPSGVAVFTSDDKQLLKEQADKLLAKKVRYTVTGDRILVAEKQVAEAREVLWGDDGGSNLVAVAEEESEELDSEEEKPRRGSGRQKPERLVERENMPPSFDAANRPTKEIPAYRTGSPQSAPKPVTTYDYRSKPQASTSPRKMKEIPGYNADRSHRPSAKGVLSTYNSDKNRAALDDEGNSALKRKGDESPMAEAPSDALKKSPPVTGALRSTGKAKSAETPEQRRQRLKDLALGVSKPTSEKTETTEEDYTNEKESVNYQVSRARKAPSPPVVTRSAPVANAVTIDLDSGDDEPPEIASVDQAQDKMPSTTVAEESRDEGWTDLPAQGSAQPSASAGLPPPAPPLQAPGAAVQKPARQETKASSSGSADLRVASIRGSQAAVARRYNVVLSVESRGSKINVYVRPKGELSKSETEELRKAIRAELGLAPQDSIIFR